MRAAVALEIFLNFLTMLLNDSSGYFFHRLFLYTLISFLKILQIIFITAGALTFRVGFQLLGQFYQNFTTSQVLLQMNF